MSMNNLVGFAIAAVLAAIVAFPCAGALRKHPGVFYALAVAATALYVWALGTGEGPSAFRPLLVVMQKGYLACLFLGIVMFTGVLDEKSALRLRLQPIRGELSILSFIFIVGHLLTYLPGYLPRLGTLFSGNATIAVSLVVAVALTALFAVLAAMSLRVVRRSMNPRTWKAVQRASYVMMALLVLHVGLMLGMSAFGGGVTRSTWVFWVYVAVVVLYAVLRIRKACADRAAAKDA
ncbi:MAG: ferric reductase-like transmembrane domain-containing protein [Eggerthellaceae bacterium]|nr:ferric reductase-like transmembrane domain-containing protein [Eggerthellaceae bacterium]